MVFVVPNPVITIVEEPLPLSVVVICVAAAFNASLAALFLPDHGPVAEPRRAATLAGVINLAYF